MKTIAEHMKDILIENNTNIVWYGDLEYIEECATRSGMRERDGNKHPLAINNRILSALDRSSLFTKSYIKHIGRPSRCFRLIEEVRQT